MTKSKKKNNSSTGFGAGLATAAIGAALATYLLTGNRSGKTKKVLKGWMLKAKGELLAQMEKAGDVGEDAFNNAVDKLASKYSKFSGITKEEIDTMTADLKKQWRSVNKGLKTKKNK